MARRRSRRPHGQGCVYQRGPGNFWIKWREGGQIRYKGGYPSQDFALQVLAKIANNITTGEAGLPRNLRDLPSLSELAAAWHERRKHTHRSWRDDRNRWRLHLEPFFGALKPPQADAARIRRFVEAKRATHLSSTTVGHLVRLLSTFMSDVVEQGFAQLNPVGALPRSTRRLYRNATDPLTTPFLEKADDIRRVFLHLPEPINIAFAVGALGGLRTGEVLGLEWQDIDLKTRRIHVRQQVNRSQIAPLKDDDSRLVPILTPLMPILAEWKLKTGGAGLLFKPTHPTRGGRPGTPAAFVRPNTLALHLREALAACKLPTTLTWYHATRHTFASQWVLGGGMIEKLSKVLGHASVVTTERYAHLRTDLFREADFDVVSVDLRAKDADVATIGQQAAKNAVSGANGYAVVTGASDGLAEAALTY